MAVEVGDQAPDFELKDQHGNPVTLSGFRGSKNVVLVFYPLAFSGVCSSEMCAMRDDFPEVTRDDVELLTVSVDSMFVLRTWAEREHFDFTMLADFWPHGEVARAYGVFDDKVGVATRGTFIIDKNGVVRWKVVNPIPQAREIADYQKALAELDQLLSWSGGCGRSWQPGRIGTGWMPCYRCGTRQVDPDRGESRWRRGVRGDRQVLICPDCQLAVDWTADLDRCQTCGSIHLVRRLGEVECRDCGAVGQAAEASASDGRITEQAASDLADEVERALAKVLGPSRQRPPYAMS